MKDKIKTFKDIIAWQKSHLLVLQIYQVTKFFPKEEKFGLISQMRRAAISVSANIVEGFARKKIKDTLNFYNMSNSSLEELKYLVLVSFDLDIINNKTFSELAELAEETGRVLQGWIYSQQTNDSLSL
jgi:four helix bundle protein